MEELVEAWVPFTSWSRQCFMGVGDTQTMACAFSLQTMRNWRRKKKQDLQQENYRMRRRKNRLHHQNCQVVVEVEEDEREPLEEGHHEVEAYLSGLSHSSWVHHAEA